MEKFKEPIRVTKTFLPPINEYVDELNKIWKTRWVTNNGQIQEELECNLREYLGGMYVSEFTNGHSALDIAIKSLDLQGEVITTPFTFVSTTNAIVLNGLKPVFCDIKMDDFTIDEDKIEDLITDKTCAIVPVHVFGYPCNVDKIEKIAKKHNLKVIYDSAHAFGVKVNNKGIGTFGDISMFSLHATKVYNTIEGGLLATKDLNLKNKFDKLKNFGIVDEETVEYVGLNAKMNEFQAAMGVVNLRYVDDQIDKRKKIIETYRKELSEVDGIYFSKEKENIRYNYAYFPILINGDVCGITRNELYIKLHEYNVFPRKYFYPLITDLKCYRGLFNDENLKISKDVVDKVMTLPLYGDLAIEDVKKIANVIKEIIADKRRVYATI